MAFLGLILVSTPALAAGTPAPRMPTVDGTGTAPENETPATGGETGQGEVGDDAPSGKVTRSAAPLPEPEVFTMPSGNIGCVYTPPGGSTVYVPDDGGPELSCDIVAPRYTRATLSGSGAARLDRDVADQGCCGGGFTLNYGEVWTAGPFRCTSERAGLSCERRDGHAFFLSRKRIDAE